MDSLTLAVAGAVRLSGGGTRARLELQLLPPAADTRAEGGKPYDVEAVYAQIKAGAVAVHPARLPVRKAAVLVMISNIQKKLDLPSRPWSTPPWNATIWP